MAQFILTRHSWSRPYALYPVVNIDPTNNLFTAKVHVEYFNGADLDKPDEMGYCYKFFYIEMGTEYEILTVHEYDDLVDRAEAAGADLNINDPRHLIRVYNEGLGDDVAVAYRVCQKMADAFKAMQALDLFDLAVTV